MASNQKASDVCIGLSLEGDLLRLATVGKVGQKLEVMSVGTLELPHHEVAFTAKSDSLDGSSDFGELASGDLDTPDYSELHDFLQSNYVRGATIAVSFSDPTVRTDILDADPKDKGSAVIDRIIAEVSKTNNIALSKDQIDIAKIGDEKVLTAALLEIPPILSTLSAPLGVDKKPTKVTHITTNDIALVNITRAHFRFKAGEVVHLIYVGKDETRFYVLRGPDLHFIAPPIQQGAGNQEYVSMLNNRIELAAELAGFPKADKVVLAGAAESMGLRDEILANNPYAIFHSLTKLRVNHPKTEEFKDIHNFVLPISAAWQKLLPKSELFYDINIVPPKIRQQTNTLQLKWHGFLLIFLIIASVLGIGYQGVQNLGRISAERDALNQERAELARQQALIDEINTLETRSTDILSAATTLDTLLISSERWSETLDTLANATASLGNVWFREMRPEVETGGYILTGYSTSRGSIPSLSHRIGDTQLREITVEQISETKVYDFDFGLMLEEHYPYSGSRAHRWHDTIQTAIGDVAGGDAPISGVTGDDDVPPPEEDEKLQQLMEDLSK
ncbi:MAG: hypothetical protein CL946_01525 [Ectothiorhodospiraceae bacterium]|nr:hypothetical protein [Ectothiorhodospiraceae bacterium]